VDRTVPPVNPEGEAADGVVDAVDRANMALSRIKASRVNRVSRASSIHVPDRASTRRAREARAVDTADPPVLTAKSNVDPAQAR
jgi:hypothetical protein